MKNNIKKEWLMSIGMFSLTIAILLGRFGPENALLDFLTGMFTGVSIAANIGYLIRFSRERRLIHQHSNLLKNQAIN